MSIKFIVGEPPITLTHTRGGVARMLKEIRANAGVWADVSEHYATRGKGSAHATASRFRRLGFEVRASSTPIRIFVRWPVTR